MTGNSDLRERLGAVFFAFIMVTSMVAVGMAGFAGSAAADGTDIAGNESNNSPGASPGETINFTDINVTVKEDTIFTSVKVSSSVSTDANISQIAVYNSTTGGQLGTNSSVDSGATNVTFDTAVTNISNGNDFLYDVEVTFAGDGNIRNGTALDFASQAFNATDGSPGAFGTNADLGVLGTNTANVGNVTVDNFQQPGDDERTNLNLSITTPPDSTNGVNESTVSVALNTSGSGLNATNLTVIESGNINTAVANDNGTVTDDGGNATYDIDVALPEDEQDGYSVTLLSDVTDDGGNIIESVSGGSKNITVGATTAVNMTPDSLQVTPDANKFANTDAASESGFAANDENATVNVTVIDRFGNGLNTTSSVNATVEFVGVASGTTITNISDNTTYNGAFGGGTRTSPFQYNVSNSFAGDVDLIATDTDDTDTAVADGSAVQTFVAPINGVSLSTNRTGNVVQADGNTEIELSAQLTDSNGNPVNVPGVTVQFSNAGGFSAAGASFSGGSSATTDSSGVATVNLTADTSGQSFTVRGTEQKNTNTNTIQINTTTGEIDDGSTKFLFNGTEVTSGFTDKTGTNAVKVGTSHDVSVRVLDASNNPIEGRTVDYTLNGESVATEPSDSNGYANRTITLPNQRVTDAQLNASVGPFNASTQSAAGPANAQVNISTNATAATELQFVTSARALPIDSQGDVEVKVVDEFGNTNESVDQSITLTSDDATVMNFSGNAQSASQNLNDNNGVVTFTVDTASSAGTATLTASTSGLSNLSDTFSVNEPASIEVTFDNDVSTSSSASAKGIANLSAQLKGPDGSDLAVSGTTINFATVSGSAAELNQSGENFQNSTNSNGVATIQVNATSETGTTTFRALADNGASGTGTITTTGARSAIQLTPASSSVAENNSVNVTASFVDSEGRVVPRTDSITLTTSTGSLDSNSKSTSFDSDGTANVVFNYTADGNTGEVTLDAVGGGVTGSTTVTVTGAQSERPADLPDAVSTESFSAVDSDGDGNLAPSEIALAINENAEQGNVNGQQVAPSEFALMINYNAEQADA